MSAEIIPFVPRPRDHQTNETLLAFRSPIQPEDLVMDHADNAPCEYVPPCERHDNEPA